jgi:hypothetical protein
LQPADENGADEGNNEPDEYQPPRAKVSKQGVHSHKPVD